MSKKETIGKIKRTKFIILTALILAEVTSIFLMYMSLSDKETIIDNVALNKESIINKDMFAIMLNDGSGDYTESSETNFSNIGSGYVYSTTLSGCIDMNGNKIDDILNYNVDTKKVTVNTNKTVYCYLYFGKGSTADELIQDTTLWSSGLENDGYRYIGTNPDNYICFGTIDKAQCTSEPDKYMYRIIGVFKDAEGNNHIKLIKKDSIGDKVWNTNYQTDVGWENSDLYKGLNGDYFLSNSTYMPSGWENKITDWTWRATNTKTWEESNGLDYYWTNPKGIYQNDMLLKESGDITCANVNDPDGTTARCAVGDVTPVSAKVGLMYASDYALSLGDTALSMTTGTYENKGTLKTSWMYLEVDEWTISRAGQYSDDGHYRAWRVSTHGNLGAWYVDGTRTVRPTFYLNKDIAINGIGTIDNPYLITN